MIIHSGKMILCLCVIMASCAKESDLAEPGTPGSTLKATPDSLVEPISLNEENPHYFNFRGKPTILITSGEHYGSVINLDFDYTAYLDELQSRGFNLTRTFAGAYVEFPGWYKYDANQPLSPAPGRFICPWQRSNEPGYINGGNKFDLTKWDEAYFARLKDFMSKAAERGIIVELSFFTSYYNATYAGSSNDPDLLWKYSPLYRDNNINGIGDVPRTKALTMDDGNLQEAEDAYVRKIVTELKDYDNLIFEICNEPYIQDLGSYEWQSHIAEVIQQTESEFGYTHLLTQNISNGASVVTDPVAGVSVFNFHYSNPKAILLNYDINSVIGNNETDGMESNLFLRVEAWDFILGGGGLFNNLDMSFSPATPAGGPPDGERAVLRSWISILQNYINGFDFIKMKPDTTLFKSDSVPSFSAEALSEPGVTYAIYLHKTDLNDTSENSVEFEIPLPPGKYTALWMNTTTGEVKSMSVFMQSPGKKKFKSPVFKTDIALSIRQKPLFKI